MADRTIPMRAPQIAATRLPEDPATLAATLHSTHGFVFLDSRATTDKEPPNYSIIATNPIERRCGTLGDKAWHQWQREIDEHWPRHQLTPSPTKDIWIGNITYEGLWSFSRYHNPYIFDHQSGLWTNHPTHQPPSTPTHTPHQKPLPNGLLPIPDMDRNSFCDKVRRAQQYIAKGDIYQVNLSQRFTIPQFGMQDAWPLYEKLRRISPAPYGGFWNEGDHIILGVSPESFLRFSGDQVRSRPIKGTRPRSTNLNKDQSAITELIESPKERGELLMITDLLRNDLGQIAQIGSVEVPELLRLQSFSHVHHLFSTITARLRDDIGPAATLHACFPGGSITGAPKFRARQIISELEPVPRGIYTGTQGFISPNGLAHFNIAIRTAVLGPDGLSFHVGAGIVADSDPDREYEETLHKGQGLAEALGIKL